LIDLRWLNIPAAPLDELLGGDPIENAGYLEGILAGKIQGAKRDLTLVNAAGGFVVAGLCNDMSQGLTLARDAIDSGRALEKLRALQQFSAS
jgi:anthranilate phosphoribosyltransferase